MVFYVEERSIWDRKAINFLDQRSIWRGCYLPASSKSYPLDFLQVLFSLDVFNKLLRCDFSFSSNNDVHLRVFSQ